MCRDRALGSTLVEINILNFGLCRFIPTHWEPVQMPLCAGATDGGGAGAEGLYCQWGLGDFPGI